VQIHCEPNQPGQLRYGLRPSLHCPGANQQPGETERPVDQYTYPQLQNQNATIRPGSILNRQGGSKFNRRRQLGRQTDYYESYHRLSGSSHISGEDTLIWLLSLDLPAEKKHQLALEAWAYSTMMTQLACTFFIDAAASSVIAYGRVENTDLSACRDSLAKAVGEIAKQAGVPTGRSDA
jgi:hypothetical protein